MPSLKLWSENKNQANLHKHGISFEAAQLVFDDPLHVTRQDRIENGEQRWQTLGLIGDLVMNKISNAIEDQVKKLAAKPETEIDFSDIPETSTEDWQNATRGKFYQLKQHENTTIMRIDNDVAAMFSNAEEVNEVLRFVGKLIQRHANVNLNSASNAA